MNKYRKTVIVTGAAKGIGKGIADKFLRNNFNVVIADIDDAGISKENFSYIKTNVSNYDDVKNLVNKTMDLYGRIDVLVNNAGICKDKIFENMSVEEWQKVIDVNLNGCFYCCKEVVPHMKNAGQGRIINIASLSGHFVNPGQANYGVAKAGVIALTKYLGVELAKHNIMVNAVSPGMIDTDLVQSIPAEILNQIIRFIPQRRLGKVDEVAEIVYFLASDMCSYVNGQIIQVTGGLKV